MQYAERQWGCPLHDVRLPLDVPVGEGLGCDEENAGHGVNTAE